MNVNIIETSGLGKRYGSTWALRECSLAVPAGHVTALVGPNGTSSCCRRAVSRLCPPRIGNSGASPAQCLTQHGYTLWTSYQPGNRFWPFQWIEGGWLLALSVLLIAATVWLVRRRAT
jgi:hypothetical protein